MGTLTFRMLAGGIAGLLVWMIFEPQKPPWGDPEQDTWQQMMLASLGAMLGLAVGGLNGFLQGGWKHTLRGTALGAVFGLVGGALGLALAAGITYRIFGRAVFWPGTSLGAQIVARTLAIAIFGMVLGSAIGLGSLTLRRGAHGLLGGLIGGAIAGILFDIVGTILGPALILSQGVQAGPSGLTPTVEVGGPSRAIMMLLLGSMIALFTGLVERVARQAWVRQQLGRNEGREWAVYGAHTTIGRDERAQIPIFGDPYVAPLHATIVRQPGGFVLVDAGSGAPTYLNGAPVAHAPLHHGAHIQVGGTVLQFLLRGGRATAPAYAPQPQAAAPQGWPSPTVAQPMAAGHAGYGATIPAAQPASAATPAFASSSALVAVDGPLAGRRFEALVPLEFGRESASVPLSHDSSASRRHARVERGAGGLVLTDLGSTNGTFVNGQRVGTATLRTGDLVRIGATTFRVE